MIWDGMQFCIYSRTRYAKKSKLLIETKEEEKAVKALLEVGR